MSDEIVPKGTTVTYHGSLDDRHGRYKILGLTDLERRKDLTPEQRTDHWPDGIAYELWPVGVPYKFDNICHGYGLNSVRRQSFTVVD